MKPLVIIAAIAANGVIGRDNTLLWRLRSDLKRFRALTIGKPVIMGRKTFDSIGKPLPGRETILVTRDRGLAIAGVTIAHSFDEAITAADAIATRMGASEIMVAGGGEVYAALIGRAERMEITEVALQPEGDAFFPLISPTDWREISRQPHAATADDEAAFAFVSYQRRQGG